MDTRISSVALSKKASRALCDVVEKVYAEDKNYLIEYSKSLSNSDPYCIIYFSSNNIYYPEAAEYFYDQLVRKNRYEWYRTRIDCGTKHIFVRDVKRQHYLGGINSQIDTMEKVTNFLSAETRGYKTITLGSSSGGYAAVFFGQRLNAERIYCFNGQFVLETRYFWEFEGIEKSVVEMYSNLKNFFTTPSKIFYFNSNRSPLDRKQLDSVRKTGVNVISFNSRIHGIPFLKCCLPVLLNIDICDLKILTNKRHNPLFFSIRTVGILKTLIGCWKELQGLIHHGANRRVMKNALFVWLFRITG